MNNETIDQPQPKRTISEAQLAANRANALKSTSPRTFENFVHDSQLALEVVSNVLEQFKPPRPAEHPGVH